MKTNRSTKAFLVLITLALTSFKPTPNYDPNAVVGTWLSGTKRGHVEIYKQGDRYFGKITWLSEPTDPVSGKPKVDLKNSNSSLRSRPVVGLNVMSGFVYNGGRTWEDGKIYNPEDGREYSCRLTLKDSNTLDVRGYFGISLIGKSQTWTRMK